MGKNAASNSRHFLDETLRWIESQHRALLRSATREYAHFTSSPAQWLGRIVALAALLIFLLNLGPMIGALRARALRKYPERAPRESAALWYDHMVNRMARRGWRKLPSQTPLDFVAAIQESALQKKVARFTSAYESARFGQSVEDAQSLPGLFDEVVSGAGVTPRSNGAKPRHHARS